MTEFFSSGLTVDQLHLAYMGACVLLVALVYMLTRQDHGDIAREAARQAKSARERGPSQRLRYETNLSSPADRTPWYFLSAEYSSLAHIVAVLAFGLLVLTGWRIPSEIIRFLAGDARFDLLLPSVDHGPIGRAAQIVGAMAFGLCALRLMRMLVPIFGVLLLIALIIGAFDYVLEANWIGMVTRDVLGAR